MKPPHPLRDNKSDTARKALHASLKSNPAIQDATAVVIPIENGAEDMCHVLDKLLSLLATTTIMRASMGGLGQLYWRRKESLFRCALVCGVSCRCYCCLLSKQTEQVSEPVDWFLHDLTRSVVRPRPSQSSSDSTKRLSTRF